MRKDRLRVLVLSRSYPNDVLPSLGLWVEQPTKLLAARCDVRVVAPSPWCPPLPDAGPLRQYVRFRRISRREIRSGIEVVRPRFLAGPGSSLHPIAAKAQELGMRRAIAHLRRTFPFDLVHAHMIYPEGAVAHRLSERYGVPFVVTEHAPWTEERFASRIVRRDALAAAGAASSLLAVSTSVRDVIVSYGVERERVRVIPIGVNPETFSLGTPERRNPEQVLFVGWLNFMKGVDVLLRAMELLKRQGSPARLLLVGGALYRHTRLQEEELRRLATRMGLDDRVTFAGRRSQDEVARLMAESAVVVLPSRAESFGAVLVEALACGTPVVATRCGGPEDIVRLTDGVLVAPDDPEALASALATVLGDRERYVPERLRALAIERFGWGGIVERLFDTYLDAVGITPAQPASARGLA